MNLTLTGYSTALFSTWYFVEELGLLFDCGDGCAASLLQKGRKIDQIFITHADRDHLTGLMQLLQLNARSGLPIIHYPKDCGSFPPLQTFLSKFDQQVQGTVWNPIQDIDKIWIKKDVYVKAIRNNHVVCAENIYKSLGYQVIQVKSKMKQEYLQLDPKAIRQVIADFGKEATHTEVETILLSYSGDTPCENFEHWNGSEILIHEATFLGGEEDAKIQTHGNRHSNLEDVLKAVSGITLKQLILGHFSSRYTSEQIDRKIIELCQKFSITIPVYRLLPGMQLKNILSSDPIWS